MARRAISWKCGSVCRLSARWMPANRSGSVIPASTTPISGTATSDQPKKATGDTAATAAAAIAAPEIARYESLSSRDCGSRRGRDVLLKGYIYPGKQQHGLVQFLLVRDQGDCCFGGNPKITDRVLVQLADPAGIDFTPKLTKVAGRFRVQPAGAADLQGGVLYHLDAARVR